MALAGIGKLLILAGAVGFLAGCEESGGFNPFEKKPAANAAAGTDPAQGEGAVVERDVEAPEIFQSQESALWDGRPSLGGIWVAHPDIEEAQRGMIRNLANGEFVIGALFKRERASPGPRLQVSSDAAAELGMLAGAPVQMSVVALKRETVVIEPDIEMASPAGADGDIEASSLASVANMAAAAIEGASQSTSIRPTPRPTSAAAAAPAPAPSGTKLEKPFIQIGIYSVEANANQTADLLRASGVLPTVKTFSSNDKPYWRVVVGPAKSSSDRSALLNKIKGLGFGDAYAVTN